MSKLRFHLYIILVCLIVGLIVGSIFDFDIAQALYSKRNGFGIFVSAFGTIPGYAVLAFLGGGYFFCGLKHPANKLIRLLFLGVAGVGYGASVYFSGQNIFSVNGFNLPDIYWLGFVLMIPIQLPVFYLGYYLCNKVGDTRIWILLTIISVMIFIAMVAGVTLLKNVFHRPRFRSVMEYTDINFYNWFERCSNYKSLMEKYNITKEEFRSFPSAHPGGCAMLMYWAAFIPFFIKKWEKYQIPLLYIGFAYVVFVAFTRILVGAHYLSDVSMGALLCVLFLIVANEIVIHQKSLQEILEPVEQVN